MAKRYVLDAPDGSLIREYYEDGRWNWIDAENDAAYKQWLSEGNTLDPWHTPAPEPHEVNPEPTPEMLAAQAAVGTENK
jgi:hypothetical protein